MLCDAVGCSLVGPNLGTGCVSCPCAGFARVLQPLSRACVEVRAGLLFSLLFAQCTDVVQDSFVSQTYFLHAT